MTTYELLREDEWTVDGRRIAAPVLYADRIPLMTHGDQEGHSQLIGVVSNLRREGNRILGDTDADLPEGTALTCDVDYAREQVHTFDDGRMELRNVRLLGANVNTQDNYPWKER